MNRLGKVKLSNHRVGKHLFAISKGNELSATDSDRDDLPKYDRTTLFWKYILSLLENVNSWDLVIILCLLIQSNAKQFYIYHSYIAMEGAI